MSTSHHPFHFPPCTRMEEIVFSANFRPRKPLHPDIQSCLWFSFFPSSLISRPFSAARPKTSVFPIDSQSMSARPKTSVFPRLSVYVCPTQNPRLSQTLSLCLPDPKPPSSPDSQSMSARPKTSVFPRLSVYVCPTQNLRFPQTLSLCLPDPKPPSSQDSQSISARPKTSVFHRLSVYVCPTQNLRLP